MFQNAGLRGFVEVEIVHQGTSRAFDQARFKDRACAEPAVERLREFKGLKAGYEVVDSCYMPPKTLLPPIDAPRGPASEGARWASRSPSEDPFHIAILGLSPDTTKEKLNKVISEVVRDPAPVRLLQPTPTSYVAFFSVEEGDGFGYFLTRWSTDRRRKGPI